LKSLNSVLVIEQGVSVSHPQKGSAVSVGLDPFDPSTSEFQSAPYEFFRKYRETAPVSRGADGTWYLFREADVTAFLTDERFQRAPGSGSGRAVPPEHRPFYDMLARVMLFTDPPDHTRVRSVLQRAFIPRSVEYLRPRIEHLADTLLDRVEGKGRIELISDFAYPLPFIVIAELLGIPEEHRNTVRAWSDTIAQGIDTHTSHEQMTRASEATRKMTEILFELVAIRRKHREEDLISLMLDSEGQGGELTEDELVANCIFLFIAGHMTSTHLIGNGMLALLHHPDQHDALVSEPALVPAAVEELLRYDSPVQFAIRTAAEDVELAGQSIQGGERVCALLGSANRDPAAFPDPDRLDVRRPASQHVGFGRGIHFCLGASVARLEVTVAFQTLLRRLPGLRLGDKAPERANFVGMRGVSVLPLSFSTS